MPHTSKISDQGREATEKGLAQNCHPEPLPIPQKKTGSEHEGEFPLCVWKGGSFSFQRGRNGEGCARKNQRYKGMGRTGGFAMMEINLQHHLIFIRAWLSLVCQTSPYIYAWKEFKYRNNTKQLQGLWLVNRISTMSEESFSLY